MSDYKYAFQSYPELTEVIQHFAAHVPVDLSMWTKLLYEIDNAIIAASQPPAVKGARWVKCSERLPEHDGLYCFKKSTGYMEAYITTDSLGDKWVHDSDAHTVRNWKSLEWLDESAESPTAAGDGKEAIDAFEYLIENRWYYSHREGKWLVHGTNTVMKTTSELAELYNIFKQQNK